MIKEAPSIGRVAAMVAFTLSCFGLLLYLWLQFGGPVPLQPKKFHFEVAVDEAALLVENADVRISGLDVGKVTAKRLDEANGKTIAEIQIDDEFAPIPADTRARLRQKAILGETYIQLSPGSRDAPDLEEGSLLPRTAVEESVEIDEIVRTFNRDTRGNFQSWIKELATAIDNGRGQDLNDALGNLPRFVASGEDVLAVLHAEEPALRRLILNSGRALAAVNEREGQLRELIGNANNFFGALASRNESLAEAIFIFPTFLDESKATLARLREFSVDTRPLVRDLTPVMRDLEPTLRDVGRLAPNLESLFRDLDPLIDESDETLPAAARFLTGAEPVFESLHVYLPELNPILSFANWEQAQVADFIMNGAGSYSATLPPLPGESPRHYLRQFGVINARGIGLNRTRPSYERGNAYPSANYISRARPLGIYESFDCKPTGGEKRDPTNGEPPCFVQPPSLFDGLRFPRLRRGKAPLVPAPGPYDGTEPATP
jgi:phospholipid/cholesterol/gamma-HCH transport system substrate-binding protein